MIFKNLINFVLSFWINICQVHLGALNKTLEVNSLPFFTMMEIFFLSALTTALAEHVINWILLYPPALCNFWILLMAATREAVLFTVLAYSIRGSWLSLNSKREYTYFDLFVVWKVHVVQITENHIKNPVHSLLFLTRFSRSDLLSTESDCTVITFKI